MPSDIQPETLLQEVEHLLTILEESRHTSAKGVQENAQVALLHRLETLHDSTDHADTVTSVVETAPVPIGEDVTAEKIEATRDSLADLEQRL